MKTPSFVLAFLVAVAAVGGLSAQQPSSIDLPQYTPDQRWARLDRLLTSNMAFIVGYAKSKGQSPEELGRTWADAFASGWANVKDPAAMVRAVHRNWLAFPGTEFEVLKTSTSSVQVRTNRPYVAHFGETQRLYGVTLAEYETAMRAFHQRIADLQGLVYEQQLDGDRLLITVRSK